MSGDAAPAAPAAGASVRGSAVAGASAVPIAGTELATRATDVPEPGHRRGASVVSSHLDGYRAPQVGPSDLAGLPGAFTARQLARIDEALTVGSRETGLLFSLYIGELPEPTRVAAEGLTARLPAKAGVGVVLLAVSPGQRVLQIVTARGATKRVPNQVCALAALSMRAAFVGGDLTAGVINGVRMLADAAGADTSTTNHP